MNKMMMIAVGGAAVAALGACSSLPARTGSFYECDRGTRLNVNYLSNGALVRVNGGRTLTLRTVASNSGAAYENKSGARLYRDGNQVTWNTALRSAPETCRVVATPL